MCLSTLLSLLAEKQSSFMKEQMPLHWFKASHVFHARWPFPMVDPDVERPLHKDAAQVTQFALDTEDMEKSELSVNCQSR